MLQCYVYGVVFCSLVGEDVNIQHGFQEHMLMHASNHSMNGKEIMK
jgi:hypothetical protein